MSPRVGRMRGEGSRSHGSHRGGRHPGGGLRLRRTWRVTRIALGILFAYATYFFGGLAGGLIGIALMALRIRWRSPSFFWALGVCAMAAAPFSVLVQGLAFGNVTPGFVSRHGVAHLLVGIGLASVALAAFLEIPLVRGLGPNAEPPAPVPAGALAVPVAEESASGEP